jgi:hypothetical protein
VRIGAPKDESLPPAELKALRRRFHRRKFLFPLLDQGPNNQFLQFRVALQKAHALNRTLVLPIWLPHNPKFLHFHPGAPATASRDKRLEQMWYPFEVAFDAPSLQLYVRIIPLATFRQLTAGKLERCLAHKGGFDVYLRLARLSCESFDELPEQGVTGAVAGASEVRERLAAAKDVRFLGFHQYDHELGTRDLVGIDRVVGGLGLAPEAAELLARIPRLRGGSDVLDAPPGPLRGAGRRSRSLRSWLRRKSRSPPGRRSLSALPW